MDDGALLSPFPQQHSHANFFLFHNAGEKAQTECFVDTIGETFEILKNHELQHTLRFVIYKSDEDFGPQMKPNLLTRSQINRKFLKK